VQKKKGENQISPLVFGFDSQFWIFNPSFEVVTEIQKQGAKVRQGVRQGAGLGSTLQITLIDEMVYYWCKVPANLERHLMYKYRVPRVN
jgi:hypothetical protein